ncbi:MAG: bifunctional phosphopantothenoylcysteine decarboxylase/phosphopantothenate--cysteine ligase CoaBC [Anaerolineales bacterium]|nr:bifunctional phosphopantothenoylcysteine decarboxylase/phosphopantothenate--cysteine ligase CoaBC [Anaerolineales bacterium]MCX7755228.1 bifunctional phosphopantothenoylcysteine decarboxylase/phosphopantothenate--cysteine ligase CoaBC [Anaerolineales bacterium]MDW8277501.1 bifunctional phosphopantothenoylcysteine decarboxylase/phosphopantothenate--cysteine ligase CoaBC [Anaerolineales bacterium]
MAIFTGKHILLGVTGSIAAYKAADLASKLTQQGAQVDVIFSAGAEQFITPLTFQSVTGRRAFTDADLWGGEAHILHVGLGHSTDLVVIAPCTANTLAKLAHGIADNLLTVTALAAGGEKSRQIPILIAPAMDAGMYEHPATQENVRILKERGVVFIGPAQGRMASGLVGLGRMVEPMEILGHIRLALGRNGKLAGKHLVVTAGGSQEPIDPVRYITNRSSGKQGYALAQAALDEGATVTLVTHPTGLTPPVGAHVVEVRTAQEMLEAVLKAVEQADGLVMAAAVADFRVKHVSEHKLKKQDGIPHILLEAAPDVLGTVGRLRPEWKRLKTVVGFAAESRDLVENAIAKLKSKHLDLIAANDISAPDAGFGVDTNRITLLYADGRRESLPLMSKDEAARYIIERVAAFLE